jgi:hypothetical protein
MDSAPKAFLGFCAVSSSVAAGNVYRGHLNMGSSRCQSPTSDELPCFPEPSLQFPSRCWCRPCGGRGANGRGRTSPGRLGCFAGFDCQRVNTSAAVWCSVFAGDDRFSDYADGLSNILRAATAAIERDQTVTKAAFNGFLNHVYLEVTLGMGLSMMARSHSA